MYLYQAVEYVTGKKPGENDSKYLTKFQTSRTVKCNEACEEKRVTCCWKISRNEDLFLTQVGQGSQMNANWQYLGYYIYIWSNTSPGKSNKYLYLSVHHLASLISTSIQTYQCVFISFFLSDIMASEWEFVRCSCYHTEPTQNENLCLPCTLLKINIKSCFFFFQRTENNKHSGRFAAYV